MTNVPILPIKSNNELNIIGNIIKIGDALSDIYIKDKHISDILNNNIMHDKFIYLNMDNNNLPLDNGKNSGIQINGISGNGYIMTNDSADRYIIKAPMNTTFSYIATIDINENLSITGSCLINNNLTVGGILNASSSIINNITILANLYSGNIEVNNISINNSLYIQNNINMSKISIDDSLYSNFGIGDNLTRGSFWEVGGIDRINIDSKTGTVKINNGLVVGTTNIIDELNTKALQSSTYTKTEVNNLILNNGTNLDNINTTINIRDSSNIIQKSFGINN